MSSQSLLSWVCSWICYDWGERRYGGAKVHRATENQLFTERFSHLFYQPYAWAAAHEDEGVSSGEKCKPRDIGLNPASTTFHNVWTCAFYVFPLGLGVLICKMGMVSSTMEGPNEIDCSVGRQFSMGLSGSLASRGIDCLCSGLYLQEDVVANSLRRQR